MEHRPTEASHSGESSASAPHFDAGSISRSDELIHRFRNLLTAIQLHAELAIQAEPEPAQRHLATILEVVSTGAEYITQMTTAEQNGVGQAGEPVLGAERS